MLFMTKPQPTIILSGKVGRLPIKIWNKTRMPTLTTSIQHGIGSPSHDSQARKRNTRHPVQKGRGKIIIYR